MRKTWIFCLALCLAFNLMACGSNQNAEKEEPAETIPAAETTAAATVTAQPVETTAAETAMATEPPIVGELYLTASRICFSLVGENEYVYAGSVPENHVIWESADVSVAEVDAGMVTAVGVGKTTITASFDDQVVECEIECLAATEEELAEISPDILQLPRQVPPAVSQEVCTYFDDSALIGDSISYILFQNESRKNDLGDILFLTRGGVSINSLVRYYKEIPYQGIKCHIEDAVAQAGVSKVFIMLGQNDLSYMTLEDTFANFKTMTDRILEKSPGVEIYIQSCIPEFREDNLVSDKNTTIDAYNEELKLYAEENGFYYIDIQKYVEDHYNNMAESYHLDKIHMNYDGCSIWMQALNAYMRMQEIKGE